LAGKLAPQTLNLFAYPLGFPPRQVFLMVLPIVALGENTKRGDWEDRGEHQARQDAHFWPYLANFFDYSALLRPTKARFVWKKIVAFFSQTRPR
jgi:hypothetical protein